jgi:ADP-ribose pyrophosphatase
MVDDGEHVSATVKREFEEEAGNITDPAAQARFKSMIEELFKSGQVVYRGYVDEARNTDHAWIETSVFHMHCTEEVGRLLPLEAGDDASHVMWFDIGDGSTLPNMYPPHRGWIGQVAKSMHKV